MGPNDIREHFDGVQDYLAKHPWEYAPHGEYTPRYDGLVNFPGSKAMLPMASDALDIDINLSSFDPKKHYAAVGAVITAGFIRRFFGKDTIAENNKNGRFVSISMFNALPRESEERKFMEANPYLFYFSYDINPDVEVIMPWQVYGNARREHSWGADEIFIPEWRETAKSEKTVILPNGEPLEKRFVGYQNYIALAQAIQKVCSQNNLSHQNIFGDWRGGVVPAYAIADYLNGVVVDDVTHAGVLVEDIIDTGNTSAYTRGMGEYGKRRPVLASVAAKLDKLDPIQYPDIYLMDASGIWTVNSGHETFKNDYSHTDIAQSYEVRDVLPELDW